MTSKIIPKANIIGLCLTMFVIDYLRVTLTAFGIQPPFIDGIFYVSYYVLGGTSIAMFLMGVGYLKGVYSGALTALLLFLLLMPAAAAAFLKPQHIDLVPRYMLMAFSAAVYTSLGFLIATYGISRQHLLIGWGTMFAATIPVIAEMATSGFGSTTRVADAGLHITLGDTFLFATLIVIAKSKSINERLVFFFLGALSLLAIGSRTSLYCFVAALPVILVLGTPRAAKWLLFPSALVALTVGLPMLLQVVLEIGLQRTRMFGFFFSNTVDTAWEGRLLALRVGWLDIEQSPLLGSFGSDVDRFGQGGMYIHNYLEMWRQLGIIPFAIFVILLVRAVMVILKANRSERSRMAFTMAIFTAPLLTAIVFSRSYGYPHIFFVLGLAAVYIDRVPRKPRRTVRSATIREQRVLPRSWEPGRQSP